MPPAAPLPTSLIRPDAIASTLRPLAATKAVCRPTACKGCRFSQIFAVIGKTIIEGIQSTSLNLLGWATRPMRNWLSRKIEVAKQIVRRLLRRLARLALIVLAILIVSYGAIAVVITLSTRRETEVAPPPPTTLQTWPSRFSVAEPIRIRRATFLCRDGSTSRAFARRSACRDHGGVVATLTWPSILSKVPPVEIPVAPLPHYERPHASPTFTCSDGSSSASGSRRGACSHHGGIR